MSHNEEQSLRAPEYPEANVALSEENSSSKTHRRSSLRGLFGLGHKKDKQPPKYKQRESMSERGAFSIETGPSGVPIAVENKDWPPGVNYKKSSVAKMLESKDGSLGQFYEGQGGVVPGGETAGNVGPDPDWVPGLTDEQRKEIAKSKSGRYGEMVMKVAIFDANDVAVF